MSDAETAVLDRTAALAAPSGLAGILAEAGVVARPQTFGEELANSVSHGAGMLAAAAGVPFLLMRAARSARGTTAEFGAVVFAVAVLLVYLSSSVYHAWPRGRVKRVLRVVEHSAIFLLIAGTYTPFTLGVLRGPLGWTLFAVVWALAAFGVTLKIAGGLRYPRLSTALYLLMGWLAVVAIHPLWLSLPRAGFLWLLAGGLSYTLGVVFYLTDNRLRYGHFLWHLFVMAGTACHFLVVLRYAL
ncbi:MAG: hemolysin III family protein [Elusimicrobia bacterium]|nr:hemolysin III family protein [Elusimicrobiota bacterium]